jgi:hypothetical protein
MASRREQAPEQAVPNPAPESNPHTGWLTRQELARSLEISLISVRRRQTSGQLTGELVDGQWRFSPEEVEAFADALEGEREPRSATAAAVDTGGGEARALFGAAVSLSRQAEAHNERLLALIEGPASRLLAQTTAETGELRKRIAELEQKHTALLEAAQASLDRAHERQLREQEQQAKLAMRIEALEALKQWAPVLAGRILGNRGDKPTANQVLTEALLSSLSRDQLMNLFQSGILSDAQCATLASIVQNVAAQHTTQQAASVQENKQPHDQRESDDKPRSGEGGPP